MHFLFFVLFKGFTFQNPEIKSVGMGLRINFAGGPIPAIVFNLSLYDNLDISLSIGGIYIKHNFILRNECNVKYFLTNNPLKPMIETGMGFTYMKLPKRNPVNNFVIDIHLLPGVEWDITRNFYTSFDIGLAYGVYTSYKLKRKVFPIFSIFNVETGYRTNYE